MTVSRVHLSRAWACKVSFRPPALNAFAVCAADVRSEVERELVPAVFRVPMSVQFGHMESRVFQCDVALGRMPVKPIRRFLAVLARDVVAYVQLWVLLEAVQSLSKCEISVRKALRFSQANMQYIEIYVIYLSPFFRSTVAPGLYRS